MQMCEVLLSLLKLITQMVTRFDCMRWTRSRNHNAQTYSMHSYDVSFITQLYDCYLGLYSVFCVFTFDKSNVYDCTASHSENTASQAGYAWDNAANMNLKQ